jgi:hypothetical protein
VRVRLHQFISVVFVLYKILIIIIVYINVKVWPPSRAQALLLIYLFSFKKVCGTVKRVYNMCVKLFRLLRLSNKRKKEIVVFILY